MATDGLPLSGAIRIAMFFTKLTSDRDCPTKSQTPGKSVLPASPELTRANTSWHSTKAFASLVHEALREFHLPRRTQKGSLVYRDRVARPATSQTPLNRTLFLPHLTAPASPRGPHPASSAPHRRRALPLLLSRTTAQSASRTRPAMPLIPRDAFFPALTNESSCRDLTPACSRSLFPSKCVGDYRTPPLKVGDNF